MVLILLLLGGYRIEELVVLLSKYKLFKLGFLVNKFVSIKLLNGKLGISKRFGVFG